MPLPSLVVSATTERKENGIEADPNHDNPQLSISLARTAICARFAASATKVKSLRKASVVAEDFLCVGWGGAICDNEDEDEEDEAIGDPIVTERKKRQRHAEHLKARAPVPACSLATAVEIGRAHV